jgi:Fe-S cluster assembly protein SufD
MTTFQDDTALFFERVGSCYQEIAVQDNLTRIRAKAWDRLTQIGFPTRKNNDFKPIRLRAVYNHPLKGALSEEGEHALQSLAPATIRLVFVNGKFSFSHSSLEHFPKKAVLKTLNEAMSDYSTLLNGKKFGSEENPFTLMNSACQQNGLFIYVPPKMILEEPIQIIHLITSGSDDALLLPKLSVFLGAQSELKLEYETLYRGGRGSFSNALFEFDLEEGAHLHLTETLSDTPEKAFHFQSNRATLKANSVLKSVYITNGAALARNDFHVALNGEGAETHLSGLWILRDKKESHNHVTIEHNAPNCHSMQLFKGVLHDETHSSFNGKIWVDRIAQKTEAYQLNNNLVMSPKARAETKPNLEIFADDVKASHGATVGELQEEQLFYLLSRGIPRKKAEEILIHGFCQDVVRLLPYHSLKKTIEGWE